MKRFFFLTALVYLSILHVAAINYNGAALVMNEDFIRTECGTAYKNVLKEVSETILMILLLVSSCISRNPELSTLSWLVVVADVVLQTVLKLTYSYSRIIRKRILTEGHRSGENCRDKDK